MCLWNWLLESSRRHIVPALNGARQDARKRIEQPRTRRGRRERRGHKIDHVAQRSPGDAHGAHRPHNLEGALRLITCGPTLDLDGAHRADRSDALDAREPGNVARARVRLGQGSAPACDGSEKVMKRRVGSPGNFDELRSVPLVPHLVAPLIVWVERRGLVRLEGHHRCLAADWVCGV